MSPISARAERRNAVPARRGALRLRTRRAIVATAAAAALVTAAVAVVPSLHFAYRNPDLHVSLLTAEALIALLSAYLVLGRLRRRRALDDLMLCLAFTLMAVSNLLFAALPAVVGGASSVFRPGRRSRAGLSARRCLRSPQSCRRGACGGRAGS